MGDKSRLETRVLPSAFGGHDQALYERSSGRKRFSISSGMFWFKHLTTTIRGAHESFPAKMENAGNLGLHLPRRHFDHRKKPSDHQKSDSTDFGRLGQIRVCGKSQKIVTQPVTTGTLPGISTQFHQGFFGGSFGKDTVRQTGVGKIGDAQKMTPRKMGAILGVVRSFFNSHPSSSSVYRLDGEIRGPRFGRGWLGHPLPIPPELVQQVKDVKDLLSSDYGRPFEKRCVVKNFYSDASDIGWAGKDLSTGNQVHEFWRGNDKEWHINLKELHASCNTVKSFAKPGETIHLKVDNQVTYSYLKKIGGKIPIFNEMIRPLLLWCQEHQIKL